MLLLLTLVLFASPACRVQEMQGRNVGPYFYTKGEGQGQIQAIRVGMGDVSIKGVFWKP